MQTENNAAGKPAETSQTPKTSTPKPGVQQARLNQTVAAILEDEDSGFGKIDFDKLIPILNKSLGWIIVFILFSGAAGYLYLRWTRPVFESNSIIKLDVRQRAEGILTAGMGGFGSPDAEFDKNLSGEIELIRSSLTYNKLIDRMPLNVTYNQSGKFLFSELYKTSPFKIEYEIKSGAIYDTPIDVEIINANEYILKYKMGAEDVTDKFKFGKYYENDYLRFRVTLTGYYNSDHNGVRYFITINSRNQLLKYLETNTKAKVLNANANTLQITFADFTPEKAQDIVNNIDSVYLYQTLEKKNQVNIQTLKFLDDQLDTTARRLEMSEAEVENFFKRNKSLDMKASFTKSVEAVSDFQKQKLELNLELAQLNDLQSLVSDNRDVRQFVPNMRYLKNKDLTTMADKLNDMQLELQSMLFTSKEGSTAVKLKKQKTDAYRLELLDVIELTRKETYKSIEEVNKRIKEAESEFETLPSQDTKLTRIRRFYALNEKFYLLLIERKAEFGIAKAGIVPDFSILSSANLPTIPVSPQKGSVYTIWIIIGVAAGIVLVVVRYMLQDTVVTMKEIEKNVAAPLLGVVPVYTKEKLRVAKMVVDKNPKSSLSESLRAIRTNIDFLNAPPEPGRARIISVTSTVASEGKTFIAINLSGVLALSSQRVIIIDLDLRKPKLHLAFDLNNEKGMSTLLIGKHTVDECIAPTTIENVDVICAGTPPPNPSELLLRANLDVLFDELSRRYDIIVIDSPPVGLVTDGIIVMQKADLPIYVVRSEYSKRIYLKNINKLVKINGFTNMAVILNGLDKFKTYGYGYGYGYDYYTDDDLPQGFNISWIKNLMAGS
ncbi:MAG: polysaccharide biosynthesis tyrosine autokinase [Bacteroidota bacterium]